MRYYGVACLLLAVSTANHAGTGYVCIAEDGRKSIQDSPCDRGASSSRFRFEGSQVAPARPTQRSSSHNNPGGYGRYAVTQCRSLVEARRAVSVAIEEAVLAEELADLERRRRRIIDRVGSRCEHIPREYWLEGRNSADVPKAN